MIKSVKILDVEKQPIRWLNTIEALHNGAEFNFTPGLNVIIGNNGCGKSTLMNILYSYTLSNNGITTEIPSHPLSLPSFWGCGIDYADTMSGISVLSDWKYRVFRMQFRGETTKHTDSLFDHSDNLQLFFGTMHTSSGESVFGSMNYVISSMFKKYIDDINYDYPDRVLKSGNSNNQVWSKRFKMLSNYYKNNTVEVDKKCVTLMLDEPDNNLDVDNLQSVYSILSFEHPQVQVIAVLHNIALIKKLSESPNVNIIEMSDGYLDKIINFA